MKLLSPITIANPQSETLFEGFAPVGGGICRLGKDVITNLDTDDRNYHNTCGRALENHIKRISGRCRVKETVPN